MSHFNIFPIHLIHPLCHRSIHPPQRRRHLRLRIPDRSSRHAQSEILVSISRYLPRSRLLTESMTSNRVTVGHRNLKSTRTPAKDDDNVSKTLSNDDGIITHQLEELDIVGIYHPLWGNARQYGARSRPVAESSTTAALDNC